MHGFCFELLNSWLRQTLSSNGGIWVLNLKNVSTNCQGTVLFLFASGYIQFSFLTQSLHFVFNTHVLVLVALVIGLFIILSRGSGNPYTFGLPLHICHLVEHVGIANLHLQLGQDTWRLFFSQVKLMESPNYPFYSLEVRKMGLEYVLTLRKWVFLKMREE